jgi:hypothetical protein
MFIKIIGTMIMLTGLSFNVVSIATGTNLVASFFGVACVCIGLWGLWRQITT